MEYSIVGMAAIVICFCLNYNTIFRRFKDNKSKATRFYVLFIFSILAFFAFDVLWGFLDQYHLMVLLFIDTELYFVAMILSVALWARFVTLYIEEKSLFHLILMGFGISMLVFGFATIILNIFVPVLFKFEDIIYYPLSMRYALLVVQVVMFLLTSVYCFIKGMRTDGRKKIRHIAIGFFGVIMSGCIVLQTFYPYMPFYAIGCMIGLCVIHVFVVSDEREESLRREERQKQELNSFKSLAYQDALTGSRNKHAYVVLEEKIDKDIAYNNISYFSVVVFDINGLKAINDTKGHEAGDEYIKLCYEEIHKVYKDIPIYRFGGDEFVVVLTGDEFDNRHHYFEEFEDAINKNLSDGKVIVSSGMADFILGEDNTFRSVFMRADHDMYVKKAYLKRNAKRK